MQISRNGNDFWLSVWVDRTAVESMNSSFYLVRAHLACNLTNLEPIKYETNSGFKISDYVVAYMNSMMIDMVLIVHIVICLMTQ